MAKNRAHNTESRTSRLARLQNRPVEAIETLLHSIDDYFNNEIRITTANLQTSLLFLGIHAAALTIGEAFFNNQTNNRDLKNYRDFLETFVDGQSEDTRFSTVADDIHNWRNILAHAWIGSFGHRIEYDYQSDLGWERAAGKLIINPRIYCDMYLQAFSAGGRIWQYNSIFTSQEVADIQTRIVDRYTRR